MSTSFSDRLPLALLLGITACVSKSIVSQTSITGSVNGRVVVGKISASIDPARGGRSICEFQQLPEAFNPGTFNTHA